MQAGGAILVRELELDRVPDLVRSLLDDPPRLKTMGEAMLQRGQARRRRRDRRRAARARAMTGRRLWFVGIGGAGLSAYAQLARAWGAEVGGWDRVRTPYLEQLGDVPVEISPEPHVPDGWEAVVSSAYPDVPGMRRKEFLRELVAARPSIAVAGSHGKGTTAALIAFALRETGRDPAWLIGAPVPQLGSNAGFGSGYLVVEADESDRTAFALAPEIAVVTNLELDHHTEFASAAELEHEFERWLADIPHVVRDASPFDGELALPGAHNRANAGAALAALELAGVSRDEAAPALARFTGTARRFEVHESGSRTLVDDYGHHPSEVAAAIAATRERFPGRRVRVLFQPHLYSRTRHLAAGVRRLRWPPRTTSRSRTSIRPVRRPCRA